jgi:hypothetical protein
VAARSERAWQIGPGKATELLRRREVLIPKRLKLKLEREICRGGFESWNV